MANPDKAGRVIAGLLGYNPGPGIYSRLERAVEAMPPNVRVEELPGLLKRYKEGVPGWELKEADFPGLVGDAKVIPRQDLLDRVRERSPVFTHGEVVLGGRPQMQEVSEGSDWLSSTTARPDYQFPDTGQVSRLGRGVSHGPPKYRDYGQGGQDYAELLLTQPNLQGDYGSHWDGDTKGVVAHARYDTHGDALRINELQSDLGIFNRRAREDGATPGPMPFPLEDAWSDILIKRLALEAARRGHRAIEVASPRAIADKVGGNIENYEHFYGKVVPGAIERLGRKMGGVVDATPPMPEGTRAIGERLMDENARALREMDEAIDATDYGIGLPVVADIGRGLSALEDMRYRPAPGTGAPGSRIRYAADLPSNTEELARMVGPENMNEWMLRAQEAVAAQRRSEQAIANAWRIEEMLRRPPPTRRYLMSDEMRKRILTSGIGASLLAPMAIDSDQE